MASVNFLYRSKKDSAPLTLRLLFRHNHKDYTLSGKTRLVIPKNYWDKFHTAQRIKDAEMKALQASTRAELHNIENHVLKAFHETAVVRVTKNWLAGIIQEYYQPILENERSNDSLIEHLDSYISIKGNDLGEATKKKYRVVKKMLQRFEDDTTYKLQVSKINLQFKKEFENYSYNQDYSTNTIAKAFKVVKTICKFAKKRGVDVSPELDEVKLKPVETDTLYLSPEDLKKIENCANLPDYLDNARDWLLISCYTGQRVSDFMRFNQSMIVEVKNSKSHVIKVIQFTQSKTKSPVTIPLHSKVLDILNKRKGRFPRKISDQKYNAFIKEVCKRANLTYTVRGSKKVLVKKAPRRWRKKTGIYEKWELVSSHIGRRSFATNNYGKIPTAALAYATGHKSEAMFLKYMGKNEMDMALLLADYF